MKTRREFLSIVAGSLLLTDTSVLFGVDTKTPWKIGICDWDVRSTGRSDSFAIAKELGFEGVQVSYQPKRTGQTSNPETLADKANRLKYVAAAKEAGVSITSLCIGSFNEFPFATTPEAESWVKDCLEAMDEMKVDQVLLPFFWNGDMKQYLFHYQLVLEKFKKLAPIAEKKKKIFSIESTISAENHIKLIDTIGSDAVRVYYDVRNSMSSGYDIYKELELLGSKKLISEIHFKDKGRIGEGDIDFVKVRNLMEKIGYEGWIVVEGSTSGDWKESQTANAQFIKKLIGR